MSPQRHWVKQFLQAGNFAKKIIFMFLIEIDCFYDKLILRNDSQFKEGEPDNNWTYILYINFDEIACYLNFTALKK